MMNNTCFKHVAVTGVAGGLVRTAAWYVDFSMTR
jgi:hypothetical protein